jgi:hypothetical protein
MHYAYQSNHANHVTSDYVGLVPPDPGHVYGLADDKMHLQLDDDNVDPDDPELTLSPFPNPDVEYYDIQIKPKVKVAGGIKRPREDLPMAPAMTPSDIAQSLLDGKAGKRTREVQQGEGLRIPLCIQQPFQSLYPSLYWLRKEKGESMEKILTDWGSDLTELQQHIGAAHIKNPQLRDDLQLHKHTLLQAIKVPINDRPKNRREWERVYWHAIAYLKTCVLVSYGQSSATNVETTTKTAFKKGLLDFEEVILAIENVTPQQVASTGPTPTPTSAVTAQEFRNFQSEVLKMFTAITQGGGYRGGRGGGRGSR